MAYASVASLLETIDLVNYHRDSSISPRFKDQITSLHQHASFLRSFLDDDPKRANNWEETIREVTDIAEEIIDLFVSDSLLKKSSNSQVLHYNLDELEKVREEMESTTDRLKGRRSTKPKEGHDEQLTRLISHLHEGSLERETIAIVGMGGRANSILASNAYSSQLIVEHFDIRAWSSVSQVYTPRDTVQELLCSINSEDASRSDDDEVIVSLFKSLWGKRYLIVLDDVWSTKAWDDVRRAFPDNRSGSRILLITRLSDLGAETAGRIHELRLWDEDRAWNMLQEEKCKGDPCPFQLESIGKTIARSCGSFLLSIEVVSGILAADQTVVAWEDVSKHINIASEAADNFFDILDLSYTQLPHHLRPCILYFGCFPKNHKMRVSKLIKLWVAEGFLNESESEKGEKHVEILVRRSLLSVIKRKSNGRIKSIELVPETSPHG